MREATAVTAYIINSQQKTRPSRPTMGPQYDFPLISYIVSRPGVLGDLGNLGDLGDLGVLGA